MLIDELVTRISNLPNCTVLPPKMIKKEKELEMKLQKQVDDFIEGNKKDIDK